MNGLYAHSKSLVERAISKNDAASGRDPRKTRMRLNFDGVQQMKHQLFQIKFPRLPCRTKKLHLAALLIA